LAHNANVLLVAGIIYTAEDKAIEALRVAHSGQNLEL
jgi:hypothetical protein